MVWQHLNNKCQQASVVCQMSWTLSAFKYIHCISSTLSGGAYSSHYTNPSCENDNCENIYFLISLGNIQQLQTFLSCCLFLVSDLSLILFCHCLPGEPVIHSICLHLSLGLAACSAGQTAAWEAGCERRPGSHPAAWNHCILSNSIGGMMALKKLLRRMRATVVVGWKRFVDVG